MSVVGSKVELGGEGELESWRKRVSGGNGDLGRAVDFGADGKVAAWRVLSGQSVVGSVSSNLNKIVI